MRVYLPGHHNHTLMVTPARDAKGEVLDGASQWKTEIGYPIMYQVRFMDGAASVDAQLGNWLIKHGYAQRTRLLIPKFAA